MDISEIKERKIELENSIKKQIIKFEYDTQTYVYGIEVDKLMCIGADEGLFVRLEVEIR